MDAQTKLKITIGELVLNQINLTSQLEAAQEEIKTLQDQLGKEKKDGTDTTN